MKSTMSKLISCTMMLAVGYASKGNKTLNQTSITDEIDRAREMEKNWLAQLEQSGWLDEGDAKPNINTSDLAKRLEESNNAIRRRRRKPVKQMGRDEAARILRRNREDPDNKAAAAKCMGRTWGDIMRGNVKFPQPRNPRPKQTRNHRPNTRRQIPISSTKPTRIRFKEDEVTKISHHLPEEQEFTDAQLMFLYKIVSTAKTTYNFFGDRLDRTKNDFPNFSLDPLYVHGFLLDPSRCEKWVIKTFGSQFKTRKVTTELGEQLFYNRDDILNSEKGELLQRIEKDAEEYAKTRSKKRC